MDGLFVKEKNLIRARGLHSPATGGGYINNATLTAKIFDSAGIEIDSITLVYVGGSNGIYEAFTSQLNTLVPNTPYKIQITDAAGYVHEVINTLAQVRSRS